MKVSNVKDMIVCQKSMVLVDDIYKITKSLPHSEDFALSNQIRRSVVSIPSNIAEGFYRSGAKEYLNFLSIARGSCAEVETQLFIIKSNYPEIDILHALSIRDDVHKILNTIITNIKINKFK